MTVEQQRSKLKLVIHEQRQPKRWIVKQLSTIHGRQRISRFHKENRQENFLNLSKKIGKGQDSSRSHNADRQVDTLNLTKEDWQ